MAQVQRASGVLIEVPDGVAVNDSQGARKRRRGEVSPASSGALADVIGALQGAEFSVLDTFELSGAPEAPGRRRRGQGGPPELATLTVGVDGTESAAVLVEEDGYLSWHFPTEALPTPGSGRRRRGGGVSTGRELRFELDLGTPTLSAGAGRQRRGIPILGRHIEKVTAAVLRFVLPPVIGAVVGHLERNRLTRLVGISTSDALAWDEFTGPAPVTAGRRTRALILIHGTFSSTRGGFGALSATEWGRTLLDSAIAHYDCVIGYDHRTLSVDPAENATDLLDRLRQLWPDGKVDLDVVCHSRGGLVFRSLVEKVLFAYPWHGKFGKAVFVAAANSGTELANPTNWDRMADLYTNLAGAAARGLAIISPGTAAAGLVLAEVIDGVGTLVKAIVARGVKENDIPGLAAMWPAGPFIAAINSVEPWQPTPANSTYYAVTSNFEAALREADAELPARLIGLLRDGMIDQLIPDDNDTVVDVASMTKIDPTVGAFFDATLDFGDNGAVYHTNYFHQESTAHALSEWLGLVAAAPEGRRRRGGRRMSSAAIQVVSGQRMFDEQLVEELEASGARYVVIDRETYLRYAFRKDELRAGLERAVAEGRSGTPLEYALDLHEAMASNQAEEGAPIPPVVWEAGAPPSRGRTVIVTPTGTPVGVATRGEAMTATELATLQAGAAFPMPERAAMANGGGHRRERGVRRSRSTRSAPKPGREDAATAAADPETVAINVGAWTDAQLEIDQPAALVVTISREALALPVGSAAGLAAGQADPSKELKVMVIGARNVRVTGKSMLSCAVPEAGADPTELYFDITGTNLGDARIDVIIRQTEAPIARISLKPVVVAQVAGGGARSEATASASTSAVSGAPRHQMYISEEEHGGEVSYRFHLELLRPGEPPEPVIDECAPLKGSKSGYIGDLYKRIEEMWGDDRIEIAQFAEQMRSEGGTLWDDLVPTKIKRALWDNRATVDFIQVYSDEPFVPWELVHMKEPGKKVLPNESLFLGELGLVRWMWPAADGAGCNRAPTALRIRRGKVAALIPEYTAQSGWELASAVTELKTLGDAFGAVVRVPATFAAVQQALIAGYDLIHYAGHGVGNSQSIGDEALVLSVSPKAGKWEPDILFRASDIANHAQLSEEPCGQSRPLVILNCCETGRSGYTLTSIGGMASALLGAGAGVVISPLWSVDDVAAADFAKAFYTALRAGNTLAEAARTARSAIRNSGDQTWLAYTVYGEPTAKLV